MNNLNTFNSEPVDDLSEAFTAIIWGVLGFAALFITCALTIVSVGPWLPLTVSASTFVVGMAVAIASVRWRPIAAGLAFAGGVTTPFLLFSLSMAGGVG